MCAADGCPVAVEVFEGNTADPLTLSAQIDKLKQRFRLQRVVMVGDRGVLTSARLEQTLRPAGLDWITALRAPAIKQLAAEGGPLQPSLFDDRDMAEITSPDYPGERLVVCKNPLLAQERARKRAELLAATEKALAHIAARVQRARSPLRSAAAIGQAVGAVLGRRHMAKHFHISIADEAFSFAQNPLSIAAEAALDGIYVIRTNLSAAQSDAAATVLAYKTLSGVEHAFRSLKTVDLELRPVFHWTAPRVRAHVLLCMLAYYLQWHMRQSLASMLFDEPDPAARDAQRTSPVAKAEPSPAARRKAARKRTEPAEGEPLPVHSFNTLLGDLATLTRNIVRLGRDRLITISAPLPAHSTAPSTCSALPPPRRQTGTTTPNHINALRSKAGKVRPNGVDELYFWPVVSCEDVPAFKPIANAMSKLIQQGASPRERWPAQRTFQQGTPNSMNSVDDLRDVEPLGLLSPPAPQIVTNALSRRQPSGPKSSPNLCAVGEVDTGRGDDFDARIMMMAGEVTRSPVMVGADVS